MISNNKVFITGSSGFIGKPLSELLFSMGYEVLGFDLKDVTDTNYKTIVGDINDKTFLSKHILKFSPNYIIHLAARCDLGGSHIDDYKTNIIGVKNLLDCCQKLTNLSRILLTSSQLVCKVGYVPSNLNEYFPNTVYGSSKVISEKLIKSYQFTNKCEWVILRPTTVWGPEMNEHHASFIKHIHKGLYFHPGNDNLFKSYSYIGNIIYQFYKFLSCKHKSVHGNTYYLADYEPLSIREYANNIAIYLGVNKPRTLPLPFFKMISHFGDILKFFGMKFPLTSFRLNNLLTEYIFDLQNTKEVCGRLPYDFKDGCKLTVRWYKSTI